MSYMNLPNRYRVFTSPKGNKVMLSEATIKWLRTLPPIAQEEYVQYCKEYESFT